MKILISDPLAKQGIEVIRQQSDFEVDAKTKLSPEQLSDRSESLPLALVNLVFSSTAILGIYLSPMYLVGHWHAQAMLCLAAAATATVLLYFTWYRHLPEAAA